MAQNEKIWHPNFVEYMRFIIKHPNYKGLPIEFRSDNTPKWLATAQSDVGRQRIKWADNRATQLSIPLGSGVYAKVMYAIHPTKMKVCQICGKPMSVSFIYPNVNFAKAVIRQFEIEIDIYDSIYDLWDKVIKNGQTPADLIELINKKFGTSFSSSVEKDEVLAKCEGLCRVDGKSHLGPGAMSDFPDRFDGFHSYNRCHRATEDKGRSKENMKTYTRDRRAYEYWSDGNIQAANQFMGSRYFHGVSADHIGPISLGFVHDSHYLRPMTGSDNSAKRDRLTKDIIEDVLAIRKQTGVYPMSWYSSKIWDFIVKSYNGNEAKISSEYRNLLKQNMSNYMYILQEILRIKHVGKAFLIRTFILPKRTDFLYTYEFDNLGNIASKNIRNITGRASGEFDRFARIAIAAVVDYNDKDNRNISHSLTISEKIALANLVILIQAHKDVEALTALKNLVAKVQTRLISGQ